MDGDLQTQLMGYDRASTLFSPEGRIFQVEYAEKTVKLWGASSIGFVCKDGVVIVADKRVNDKLIISGSIYKIHEIDNHIIASAAGILSDARVLIEKAQLYAQQHRVTYNDDIDVESVVREVANIKQVFTQYGGARPFGVEIMFAGINVDGGKKLYVTDVTGNYNTYKASAIGENDDKIKDILRKEYKEDMTIKDAIKLAIKILKKMLGKEFNLERIDVMTIDNSRKAIRLSLEEIKKLA